MAASATPHTPASRPRGAARREALLEATLALLAEVGADAVTHRRVAERAQLPLASTTYWFESKEHLLTEALRFAAEHDEQRLRAAAAQLLGARAEQPVTAADVVDVISPTEDACVLSGPETPTRRGSLLACYTLMLEAARRPALQELSREWTDAYLTTLGAVLAAAGSRRPADDARLIIAATDGLMIDHLAGGADEDFDPTPELTRLTKALIR